MFKKRAAVFYRSIKTRGVAECFYCDKTRAASFLNGFKNIPQQEAVGSLYSCASYTQTQAIPTWWEMKLKIVVM